MFRQQPRPLTDEDAVENFGNQWQFLEVPWFEKTFPAIADFFDKKFHAGVYDDKSRWKQRCYTLAHTQSKIFGPGTTRIYAVCSIYPGWHYTVELGRIKTSTFAVILETVMLDKWR